MKADEIARIFDVVASSYAAESVIRHLRSGEIALDTTDADGNTLLSVAEACGNWHLISELCENTLLPEGYAPPAEGFRSLAKAYNEGGVGDKLATMYSFSQWKDDSLFGKDHLIDGLVHSAIVNGYWPMLDVEKLLDLEVNTNVALALSRLESYCDHDGSAFSFLKDHFNAGPEVLTLSDESRNLNVWGTLFSSEVSRLTCDHFVLDHYVECKTVLYSDEGILILDRELIQNEIYHLREGLLVSARLDALREMPITSDYF